MSDKIIKGLLKAKELKNDYNNFSTWQVMIEKAKKNLTVLDDAEKYFNKGLNATKEDEDRAIDKAKQITPFYEEHKKWQKEERLEKEKIRGNGGNNNRYMSPEEYKKKFRLNNNTYEDILYKKSFDITESEINSAKRYSWYESKNKELNTKLDNKISDWYDNFYGKQSSTDATGRTVRPEIKTPFLSEPKSLKTPDGYDISKAFDMVADRTSKTANGAATLQTALNSYDFEPKLKVDADIGPKTTSRTKESLMSYGVKDVANRIEKQEQQYKQTKYDEEEIQRDLDGEIL